MTRTCEKFAQNDASTLGGTGPLRVFRMSKYADETILNQWAGSPTIASMFLKEGLDRLVMLMVQIRHGNEHIDIKKVHSQIPSSSMS